METLDIRRDGDVVTIELNRPDVRNAFNDQVVLELTEAFNGLGEDVRAVVLTGAGKSFCAGADLNWMKKSAQYSEQENAADAATMVALFDAVNRWPGPVIGRINGAALGGGVGLVSCCDIVVASDRAKFGLTEVRLGLVPAVISPFVIDKIGQAKARRYFMTGEIFDAHVAQGLGLVDVVVQLEELDGAVAALVDQILQNGPKAVAESKKLVFEVVERERSDALDYAVSTIARLRVSEEGQEGLGAFLEKRKPSWQ